MGENKFNVLAAVALDISIKLTKKQLLWTIHDNS